MSYCPQFWGIRATCMARKSRYMFEIYDQKLVVFVFDDRFWRPREIYNDHKTITKNSFFSFYSRFHELLPTSFGVPRRFTTIVKSNTYLIVMTKNLSLSYFTTFS